MSLIFCERLVARTSRWNQNDARSFLHHFKNRVRLDVVVVVIATLELSDTNTYCSQPEDLSKPSLVETNRTHTTTRMRVSSVAVLAAILLSEATTAFVAPSKPVRLQKGSSSLQSGARSAAEVTKSNLKYLLVPNRKDVQKVPVTSPPSSSSSVPEPPVAAPEPVVVPEPVVAHAPEPPVIKVPHEIRSNSAFAHHKAEAVVIKSAAAPPVEVVSNSAFAVHKAEVITSAAAPPVNVDVDVHTVSMKEAIATMHGNKNAI